MLVRRAIGTLLLGLALGFGAEARAQSPAVDQPPPAPPGETAPQVDVSRLPVSLDRIERQLARPATLSLEVTQPMFRVEVVETRPRWFADIEWLSKDEQRLPMPAGPAWHRDFLAMVTPQTARPFGQSTGWDLLQLLATSFAQGVATEAFLTKLQQGLSKERSAEARAEVDAAIEAWKREREAARRSAPVTTGTPAPEEGQPPGEGQAPPASPPR